MSADRIKNDLNANLYVEASAGAGKTAALIDRVCALVASGKFTIEQIVAITFTNAAASELRYRIMESLEAVNGVESRRSAVIAAAIAGMPNAPFQTIDSFARKLLSEYHAAADMPPLQNAAATKLETAIEFKTAWNEWLDEQLDRDERFVRYFNLARDRGFEDLTKRTWPSQALIEKFASERLNLADCDFSTPASADEDEAQARHIAGVLLDYARRFTLKYTADKCARGEPGFNDVLTQTLLLLKDNQAIRREVSKRYPVVLVDEFQDTNPLQVELIRLLTSASANGGAPSGRLFAVGDLKQSIYMFRGADPYASNHLRDELARQSGLVKLEFNYRSAPPLVDWVKNLFNPIFAELSDLPLKQNLDLRFDATAKTRLF